MSDRNDLRRQTREIHEALSRFEREQLVDILTHVFRTYVMEGASLAPPPPAALGDELAGLSFAQVIERLQLKLDLPELQLFEVQGNRVSVKIDGRPQPLETPTSRAEAPARNAPPPAAAPPAPPPAATPGTQVVEMKSAPPPGVMPAGHAGSGRADATARLAAPAGRAQSAGSATSASVSRPAAPAEKPAAPPPQAKPAEKPADDNSQGGRFGLLEID